MTRALTRTMVAPAGMPARAAGESGGAGRGRRGEAAWVAGVLFAEEAHEAAQRQEVQRVLGLTATQREDARRVADAKLQHFHTRPLGREEMPELVGQNEDDQNGKDPEEVHACTGRAACRSPKCSWVQRRGPGSAAKMSSPEGGGTARWAGRVPPVAAGGGG